MDDSATTLLSLKALNLGNDIAADEAANGGGIANWAVWKSEAVTMKKRRRKPMLQTSAKYCSRECQLKAWAGHKQE
eukprot:scaffold28876_cov93-Skeletonema_marinoi.AAC.1